MESGIQTSGPFRSTPMNERANYQLFINQLPYTHVALGHSHGAAADATACAASATADGALTAEPRLRVQCRTPPHSETTTQALVDAFNISISVERSTMADPRYTISRR